MNKRTLAMWGILMLLVVGMAGIGCSGVDGAKASTNDEESSSDDATPTAATEDSAEKSDDDSDEKEEEAVPVEVAALARGPIESILSFSANLEAEDHVQVFSQAKRLVIDLKVEEGDRVRRNQVLLRLQDEEQRSAVQKVESQLAKAEREYKRQERLYQQELISEQAFNDATYELTQLKISLEDAQRELGYTEVRAPIAGTVTQRSVNLGDQVQIGQDLFEIVDFNSMVARIYVPEKHLAELSVGLSARLSAQASSDRRYKGRVQRIAPIVDARSGTIKVTIDVGNQRGLRPGMYVNVDLVTRTHDDAVLIPKRAVVYDNDQMFVFRLGEERRVERVFIEPLLADKAWIEAREGVLEGDQLVIAGQAGLRDKALVKLPGDKDEDDDISSDEDNPATIDQASL